jgi:hypothetical protein
MFSGAVDSLDSPGQSGKSQALGNAVRPCSQEGIIVLAILLGAVTWKNAKGQTHALRASRPRAFKTSLSQAQTSVGICTKAINLADGRAGGCLTVRWHCGTRDASTGARARVADSFPLDTDGGGGGAGQAPGVGRT